MSEPEAAASPDPLVRAATDLAEFLRGYGEERWAVWVEQDAERIAAGDRHGVEHLLAAFGGMGSLSDLLIHPVNGHNIPPDEVESVNERLDVLRGRMADRARAVQRRLDRS